MFLKEERGAWIKKYRESNGELWYIENRDAFNLLHGEQTEYNISSSGADLIYKDKYEHGKLKYRSVIMNGQLIWEKYYVQL